ncbi:unnamed protein product [Pneumocystis jirovecii]|uniref:Uncharacterized protein n=1 Tax=Pneumocystis jirovecii TaxID=42068 RepID=L0PFK2_PNEJI|nr:unnamed protein product [Pneumocystis jirovecii]
MTNRYDKPFAIRDICEIATNSALRLPPFICIACSGGTKTPSSKNRLILCIVKREDADGDRRMIGSRPQKVNNHINKFHCIRFCLFSIGDACLLRILEIKCSYASFRTAEKS